MIGGSTAERLKRSQSYYAKLAPQVQKSMEQLVSGLVDADKIKQSSRFQSDQARKDYFKKNLRQIMFAFLNSDLGHRQYAFDDFLIDFFSWVDEVSFPIDHLTGTTTAKQQGINRKDQIINEVKPITPTPNKTSITPINQQRPPQKQQTMNVASNPQTLNQNSNINATMKQNYVPPQQQIRQNLKPAQPQEQNQNRTYSPNQPNKSPNQISYGQGQRQQQSANRGTTNPIQNQRLGQLGQQYNNSSTPNKHPQTIVHYDKSQPQSIKQEAQRTRDEQVKEAIKKITEMMDNPEKRFRLAKQSEQELVKLSKYPTRGS